MEKTSHCLPSINSHFFLSNRRTTLCPARRPPIPACDKASWHSWTGPPGRLTRGCLTLLLFQPETWVGGKNGSLITTQKCYTHPEELSFLCKKYDTQFVKSLLTEFSVTCSLIHILTDKPRNQVSFINTVPRIRQNQ